MTGSAASFGVSGQTPVTVAKALERALAQVRNPRMGLVFTCGALGERLLEVVEACRAVAPGLPLVFANGAGVLSDHGELEDQSGASGVIWSGGRVEIFPVENRGSDDLGETLARLVSDRTANTRTTALIFTRPEGFEPDTLEALREARTTAHLLGAGTVGDPGLVALDGDGTLLTGGALVVLLRGLAPPQIRVTPACRLISPLRPITEVRGSLVTEIDGEPALDVLGAVGKQLEDQPLVFAILADEKDREIRRGGRPELLIRGVQGVDPMRRALLVSGEVREGMRLGFGIRDGNAARKDLEAVARELERDIAGAAPRFGLYLNCAGRGANLYGAPDVDSRILKQRFAGLPFAGMQSSFEIGPHGGRAAMHLYTGVFALFTAPS